MVIYLYLNCENISNVTLNPKVTGVNFTEIYKSMVKQTYLFKSLTQENFIHVMVTGKINS